MIGLEDRQSVAHGAGARLALACALLGIDARTLQRWKAHGGSARAMADRAPGARGLVMR